MLGEIGAIVKHSKRTIAMIGSTALIVSINFSRKFDGRNFNNNLAFLYYIYSVPVDFYTQYIITFLRSTVDKKFSTKFENI